MSDLSRLVLERAVLAYADREGFPQPQHDLGLDVVSVRPSGTSSKSRTARVACMEASSDAAIGAVFDSLQRLHAANPEVVPKPHKWGKFSDENNGAKSQESRVKSQ
ncbi:hypothetical protein N7481_004914 [Penicillium waksmanii]|uniref:uncharacterized protein n=1 Tax=Penicillium waksmanii TaxID=69791 RepID=UPI0025474554|nr:uncharacterized protein N7481_004914 [Penicillium waksmanii]KAJ5989704.1 hypothetical protein N7481_004914 [Penicillium waksmanii]